MKQILVLIFWALVTACQNDHATVPHEAVTGPDESEENDFLETPDDETPSACNEMP